MRTRTAPSISSPSGSRVRPASGRVGAGRRHVSRRPGFTLLELMVVIAIAAVIGGITLGGFAQMGASQKRTTCQTNMTQLYDALRLYQSDYGKFPRFDPDNSDTTQQGVGLWALYTFPDFDNLNHLTGANDAPLTGYLKSSKTLHCPQDSDSLRTSLVNANATFNLNYLSYQTKDPSSNVWTYLSTRNKTKGSTNWKRQLEPVDGTVYVQRPPADDTVVTWCPWHRTVAGGREYDNVLFYDGSVQLIPREQAEEGNATDWQRKRRPPL